MAVRDLVGGETFSTVAIASKAGDHVFVPYITTSEVGLIPAEPLALQPFAESYDTLTAAAYHGPLLQYPRIGSHLYQLSSGSWKFYHRPDGRVHSFWDGRASCWGHPVQDEMTSDTNYPPWRLQRWTLSGELSHLIRMCGTEVCSWIGLGNGAGGAMQYYRGRCWVSGISADETGQITVTLSYELQAPDDWGK